MNKNTFSNRVTWYNFILCIFVVWIHAQNTDLFTEVVMIEGKPLFNQIEQTIVSDIAVVGVAGFFLCSGYLFYRNYSWGKVLEKYKTRFVGLFIPYVIWTLLYYFIHVGVSYITPLRAVFNEPPITVTWKGIVDAVLNYRYCAFLWFLQFLILLVVLSPLIYLLISNQYMGIVAIVLVLVIDSTGICGDLAFGGIQAQAFCNWLFIYMTGGYIGIHGSGAVESKNTSWLLLLASVILAVLAYYFFKHSPSMFTNLMYLLLFAAALWCLDLQAAASDGGELAEAYIYGIHDAFSDRAGDERTGEQVSFRFYVAGNPFVFPASGALLCSDSTVLADLWKRPVLCVENVVRKPIELWKT